MRIDGTYWTITPHDYREEAGGFEINGDGFIGDNYVNDERGIRPVINIKGNAIKSGSGTANNPFSIEWYKNELSFFFCCMFYIFCVKLYVE